MSNWYRKSPSRESLQLDKPAPDSRHLSLTTKSTTVDDDDNANEDFSEFNILSRKSEPLYPNRKNCNMCLSSAKSGASEASKRISTMSDSGSATKQLSALEEPNVRASSLPDIRSPTPSNYGCSALYCTNTGSRGLTVQRTQEARRCARWAKRRDALADPYQMALPQGTREKIESEIVLRKKSLTNRISTFLRSKLDSDAEIDLT